MYREVYKAEVNSFEHTLQQHVTVFFISFRKWLHSGTVGWGTALHARRLWVWFLTVSLEPFIDIIVLVILWPLGYSASNRNECQEYSLGDKGSWCLWLTTLPCSCANCLEIWKPQPPGNSGPAKACTGIALPLPLVSAKSRKQIYHLL